MTIRELAQRRRELDSLKKEQKETLEKTATELSMVDSELYDALVEEGSRMCNFDGYTYSLAPKLCANVPEEDAEEFYSALERHGLGELVKQKVDPRTLSAEVSRQIEENSGALPSWMEPYVTVYTRRSISMRKSK